MELSQILKQLRLELGYTQKEVAQHLKILPEAYRRWENGRSNPKKDSLENLAKFFNVSVSYLLGETNIRKTSEINEIMEALSQPRQKKLIKYGKNQLKEQETENNIISFNNALYAYNVHYNQGFSAGKGEGCSDDLTTEIVYWDKKVNYDFCVPIIGESMEPKYHDRDIALIHEQPVPDFDGQVCAVFDFNRGVNYIKCVTVEEETLRLVSLNREINEEGNLLYDDLLLPRDETVKVLGKVIDSFTPMKKK